MSETVEYLLEEMRDLGDEIEQLSRELVENEGAAQARVKAALEYLKQQEVEHGASWPPAAHVLSGNVIAILEGGEQ